MMKIDSGTIPNLRKYSCFLFAASFFFFTIVLKCQVNSNNVIPVKVERNKTFITAKVADSPQLKILLDTGMAFDGLIIYNPDLRDSIKLLSPIRVSIGGAGNGGTSNALMSESMSFQIGNIQFNNQKILVLENDIYKGFPSDGIIGYSLFGHYSVELNYENMLLKLHNPEEYTVDTAYSRIPIYFKDNKIPWTELSVSIAGEEPVELKVYIDYASGEALELLEKSGMKFTVPSNLESFYLGRGLSGDIYGKRGTIKKVILGNFELSNVSAAFAPAGVRSKQKDADAIIGNRFFLSFNVVFDYRNEILYLKRIEK